ncbi:MAG: hypothetical protein Q9160_007276 [Pyrenula sp. 1 TL-2023]
MPSKENMLTPPPLNPLHSSEFYPTIGPGVRSGNCPYCRFEIEHEGGDDGDAAASVVHSRCGHAYHRGCLMKWMQVRPDRGVNPCYVCGRRDARRRSLSVDVISRRPSVIEQRVRDSLLSRRSRSSSLGGIESFPDFDRDFSVDVSDACRSRDGPQRTTSYSPAPKRSSSLHELDFADFDGDFTVIGGEERCGGRTAPKVRTRILTPAVQKSTSNVPRSLNAYLDADQYFQANGTESRQNERCLSFASIDLESLIDEPISPILPQSGALAGVRAPDPAYLRAPCSSVFQGHRNIKFNDKGNNTTTKSSRAARPKYIRSHTSGYVDRARAHQMSLPPEYIDIVDVEREGGRKLSRQRKSQRHCWASSKSNKLSMALLATVMTVVVAIVIVVAIVSARKHH